MYSQCSTAIYIMFIWLSKPGVMLYVYRWRDILCKKVKKDDLSLGPCGFVTLTFEMADNWCNAGGDMN